MLLTVNRDSAAIIHVNISDPSYQKKRNPFRKLWLQQLTQIQPISVNSAGQLCPITETFLQIWPSPNSLPCFWFWSCRQDKNNVTFPNRNYCLRSTRTHLDPILWEITDVWSLVLTVSHAVVQMWCPTGSLRLSSRLPHNVTLSVWLLLSPPRVPGFVRVPGSPLTSSLRPSQHLCAICGQKRAL